MTSDSVEKRVATVDHVLEAAYDAGILIFPFQIRPTKPQGPDAWSMLTYDKVKCEWHHYRPNRDAERDLPDNSGWQVNNMVRSHHLVQNYLVS